MIKTKWNVAKPCVVRYKTYNGNHILFLPSTPPVSTRRIYLFTIHYTIKYVIQNDRQTQEIIPVSWLYYKKIALFKVTSHKGNGFISLYNCNLESFNTYVIKVQLKAWKFVKTSLNGYLHVAMETFCLYRVNLHSGCQYFVSVL